MCALSLIPCGDGDNGIIEIVKHVFGIEHSHQSDHSHHSKGCGDDTCSPFCVCSCCSITTCVPTNTNLASNYDLLVTRIHPFCASNFYPSGYLTSIWHPPTFS